MNVKELKEALEDYSDTTEVLRVFGHMNYDIDKERRTVPMTKPLLGASMGNKGECLLIFDELPT